MELLLILFIVLIIFGAGKIPQLGEGLGKAIKGFKKAVHEPEPVEATAIPVPDQPGQPTPIAQSPSTQTSPMAATRASEHPKQA
ncbi:MAG TPA: twin-arginine translocase TatA/TatE family subunit [Nitrospiraceae bacterium]|nr:twin-arginine translocase TatA/TatE family subunit [Nitrospiraceae bacterium]